MLRENAIDKLTKEKQKMKKEEAISKIKMLLDSNDGENNLIAYHLMISILKLNKQQALLEFFPSLDQWKNLYPGIDIKIGRVNIGYAVDEGSIDFGGGYTGIFYYNLTRYISTYPNSATSKRYFKNLVDEEGESANFLEEEESYEIILADYKRNLSLILSLIDETD